MSTLRVSHTLESRTGAFTVAQIESLLDGFSPQDQVILDVEEEQHDVFTYTISVMKEVPA